MTKENLFGKTLNELVSVTGKLGMPGYSARQMAEWLYGKEIRTIEEMTNISKRMRNLLSAEYEFGLSEPVSAAESHDGTRKYLFRVSGGNHIESAFIPDRERATICLSSQAGCKMGCVFCMTGKQGFQGNLNSNEILNQFRSIPEFTRLTNIVYMGMGEPLDNLQEVMKSLEILTADWGFGWSPHRITVSTVGIRDRIAEFLANSRCNLAVSLHSPFEDERRMLVPVQKTNPIKEILEQIRSFDSDNQRRISFEYIVFRGINDTPRHIRELARILDGIRCRINLIRFHPVPGSDLVSPGPEELIEFRDALTKKGIYTTIRASRGVDISAACGLLSTINQNKTDRECTES